MNHLFLNLITTSLAWITKLLNIAKSYRHQVLPACKVLCFSVLSLNFRWYSCGCTHSSSLNKHQWQETMLVFHVFQVRKSSLSQTWKSIGGQHAWCLGILFFGRALKKWIVSLLRMGYDPSVSENSDLQLRMQMRGFKESSSATNPKKCFSDLNNIPVVLDAEFCLCERYEIS